MISTEELAALARLSPLTITELANRIGVDATNLRHSFAGKRGMPTAWRTGLLALLNLDEHGSPLSDRVHFWSIKPRGGTVRDLVRSIPRFFQSGADVAVILPRGLGVNDLRRTDTIWAFFDGKMRLVVRKTGSLDVLWTSFVIEEDVPGIKVRGGKWTTGGRIESPDYSKWQEGLVTPAEFDAIWMGQTECTWQDVQYLAARNNLSPSKVVELIMAHVAAANNGR